VDKDHKGIKIGIVVRKYERVTLTARSTTRNILAEPVVNEALTALYVVEFNQSRPQKLEQFWSMNGGRGSRGIKCPPSPLISQKLHLVLKFFFFKNSSCPFSKIYLWSNIFQND
jgi:hypothetical protein